MSMETPFFWLATFVSGNISANVSQIGQNVPVNELTCKMCFAIQHFLFSRYRYRKSFFSLVCSMRLMTHKMLFLIIY